MLIIIVINMPAGILWRTSLALNLSASIRPSDLLLRQDNNGRAEAILPAESRSTQRRHCANGDPAIYRERYSDVLNI
ncbi:hypothetical protein U9F88_000448 [Pluralibacter gergoviae]|nr:hypothetical protein [Pluralibacter gergoviae]